MLEVSRLVAGYGSGTVLQGVDLEVRDGEVLALLGRNGMGRTTLIRCLIGLLEVRAGEVRVAGRAVQNRPAHAIARLGVGLVPEGRQVFPNLTVSEHLRAFRRAQRAPSDDALFELFPRLRERRDHAGRHLSGGEQQMLAIARALVSGPKLLLLDEPTEGLAPLIRDEIWRCMARLKSDGLTILVADKSSPGLDRVADRCAIMEKGRIVWRGTPRDLRQDPARGALLGI